MNVKSKNTLTAVLDAIVPDGAPIVDTLLDETICELEALFVSESLAVREQVLFHYTNRFFSLFETWKILLSHHHHFDQNYYFVGMFLEGHEASLQEFAELLKLLRLLAAEDINEFLGQLEWCFFKLKALPREAGQQESEVDVDNVTLVVDQDVLVVSVFYLKNIANERVGCQTLTECILSFLEVL